MTPCRLPPMPRHCSNERNAGAALLQEMAHAASLDEICERIMQHVRQTSVVRDIPGLHSIVKRQLTRHIVVCRFWLRSHSRERQYAVTVVVTDCLLACFALYVAHKRLLLRSVSWTFFTGSTRMSRAVLTAKNSMQPCEASTLI